MMDPKSLHQISALLILFIFIQSSSSLFFSTGKTTQLCINSDQPNIKSMCVMCDGRKFATTAKDCTGADKVPEVTSADQAFCLITNCLRQVPKQNKIFGRRKRSVTNAQVWIS